MTKRVGERFDIDAILQSQGGKGVPIPYFAYLDAAKAMELLRQNTLDEIKQYNRGCSPEELDYYTGINFLRDFTQAALPISECPGEYYRTGELVAYEYIEKTFELQERHIKQVIATGEAIPVLLEEVRRIQGPGHEMYQSWIREETRQEWLVHIRALQARNSGSPQITHLSPRAADYFSCAGAFFVFQQISVKTDSSCAPVTELVQ